MAAAPYRDDPWQRLPWLVPAALALSLLSVTGFLALLAGPAYVPSAPAPVEMQVIELPPTPVVMPPLPEAERPPPPPVVEPEPLPLPEVKAEPPPPPPKPRPRPAKPPPSPPPPQAAAPAAPAPAAPPAAAPPDGGNMGARVLYQPKPEIPEQLRRRSLELAALARFHIAADGSAQVELVEPTPDPDLNRSLMETLKKWRIFSRLRRATPRAPPPPTPPPP